MNGVWNRANGCRTVRSGLVGKMRAFGGAWRNTAEPARAKSLSGTGGCARRVRHFLQRAVVSSDEDFRHIRYDAVLDGPEGGS
jgi:hypothetical protein